MKKCNSQQPISRRQFLKISAVAGALLAGGGIVSQKMAQRTTTVRETRLLMGTVINLAVVAPDPREGRQAVAATFAAMERLIAIFDHRRPQSALARLNGQGHLDAAPQELAELLALALGYSELTDGAFDVTVKPLLHAADAVTGYRHVRIDARRIEFEQPGMAITLDGIAKGRVVDGAVAALRERGFGNVLVEAGGDLFGAGAGEDGEPWRVGVRHPRRSDSGAMLATFAVGERAVATSGDYQNYFSDDFAKHHIVDPRRGSRHGQSPPELASATVMAPSATDADALSTAAMVLGPDAGLALLQQLPHVEGLLVTKELQQLQTTGFPI